MKHKGLITVLIMGIILINAAYAADLVDYDGKWEATSIVQNGNMIDAASVGADMIIEIHGMSITISSTAMGIENESDELNFEDGALIIPDDDSGGWIEYREDEDALFMGIEKHNRQNGFLLKRIEENGKYGAKIEDFQGGWEIAKYECNGNGWTEEEQEAMKFCIIGSNVIMLSTNHETDRYPQHYAYKHSKLELLDESNCCYVVEAINEDSLQWNCYNAELEMRIVLKRMNNNEVEKITGTKDIMRYPKKCIGNLYEVYGRVTDVTNADLSGDSLVGMLVDISSESTTELIYTSYYHDDNMPRILDGDIIHYKGICIGIATYRTVIGKNTVPLIFADTIEILE